MGKRRCFIIMPFSQTTKEHTEEYWTDHFNEFLKPLIEHNGELEAYRSEALRGDILKSIITSLVSDPIVVADLTDHNSNVYWELGVRQSFKHGTITIKEEGTIIPFDLGTKGTLTYYPGDHIRYAQFSRDFQHALNDCLENPERPDSHVLETISGRGSIYEIIKREETIRRLDALLSECIYNLETLIDFKRTSLKNQKKEIENFTYETTRLRTSAIELLLTNRYIFEENSLYDLTELQHSNLAAVNDQVNMWEYSKAITNRWLVGNIPTHIKDLEEFQGRIISIQKDLSEI